MICIIIASYWTDDLSFKSDVFDRRNIYQGNHCRKIDSGSDNSHFMYYGRIIILKCFLLCWATWSRHIVVLLLHFLQIYKRWKRFLLDGTVLVGSWHESIGTVPPNYDISFTTCNIRWPISVTLTAQSFTSLCWRSRSECVFSSGFASCRISKTSRCFIRWKALLGFRGRICIKIR